MTSAANSGAQDPAFALALPKPPAWLRILWRGLLFLALAAYFATAAMIMRGLVGGFGAGMASIAIAALATLVAGAFVLPLAILADLPDAFYCHWLPARRVARGSCPACGYDAKHSPATDCPECHARLVPPPTYAVSWRTLARALALAAPAWLAGCTVGLAIALADEHAFTVEVDKRIARDASIELFTRKRYGVANFAHLQWKRAEGFAGLPPFEESRDREWKPKK